MLSVYSSVQANSVIWSNVYAFIVNHEFGQIITKHENNLCLPDIGIMVRIFANAPRDQGSIPGRVIPKTQKMVLGATLLNTQHYKVRVKWSNPGKGVAPSSTHGYSIWREASLWVTLDYGRQLYFLQLKKLNYI